MVQLLAMKSTKGWCVYFSVVSLLIFHNQAPLCSCFHTKNHHLLLNNKLRRQSRHHELTTSALRSGVSVEEETASSQPDSSIPSRQLLVHWKGETDSGYSKPLRHLELLGALEAEIIDDLASDQTINMEFVNALNYTGPVTMANISIDDYNEAMQYVNFDYQGDDGIQVSRDAMIKAVGRCSLIHALYEIIAVADNLNELAPLAIEDGGFADMYKESGHNENATWCFRARKYGDLPDDDAVGKDKRFGARARSMKMEKDGLIALTDLLIKFGGKVDLLDPDCKIYIFGGLTGNERVLARRIAVGPKTSPINPNTRICVTNTPLEPIAAFSLCNVARVRNGFSVLDPYAGSCTTLLATSIIAPESQTVGIEIAHNGLVNRDDVRKDFSTRNLTMPRALLRGDSTDPVLRAKAREAIGNSAFDAIIADPPYGIRESSNYNEKTPLEELFAAIALDREAGHRLLKIGGRLVAFVPVTDEETLSEQLPDEELMQKAGLFFEVSREQPLNDKLSRWLVSYKCCH